MHADQHGELPVDPDERPPHLRARALVWVFAGGLCGTGLRYLAEQTFPAVDGQWPWATFGVNIAGAFILGALLEVLARLGPDDGWRQRVRLFGGTGICGALTTYSAFALEITDLARASAVVTAFAYAVVSVVLGVLGVGEQIDEIRR
ncbi:MULTISPECIES: fluoride efflux transporter FluC [unclassified Rhodococcus (in: high G+C Gram-positive bacteria)]|uniref:fluoride efflux transporter FluC n=1 Tax=unclassified Rhodococcus (in: high G+C Gram-positive bacteria) TaxID=192944 RepID=UPI00135AD9F1|nr:MULTISPECIES: CrcB family protein [unclassified Rhodococcus (in: high G+C Gram-positive bacteria)]KAF0956709.1 putative fluoride ion transporter CrcB [Rhodococcus sp. T7]KAF0966790.1 putative fluoride ion transporter CrcB [Rhodococcus sp. T7]NCL78543.1 putative fluoride ion transporter CrcB [Rhodococcus sp. YH1]NCL78564.1 putative fluoride ion transporter CrcB [Rhodococcus sp. YH1]